MPLPLSWLPSGRQNNSGGIEIYQHILIATDGSELANKGLEHGLKLASALGARATVLTATEPLSPDAVHAARMGGIEDPAARYDQQIDEAMKERFAAIDSVPPPTASLWSSPTKSTMRRRKRS